MHPEIPTPLNGVDQEQVPRKPVLLCLCTGVALDIDVVVGANGLKIRCRVHS